MDILFTEDIWSMETMPSPPHKLRAVELENEMLTHNNIFFPFPPYEDENDYVLLSLNPRTKLKAPTQLTVTKQEEFHDFDFDNNCGQFTVYELAHFECSNDQVILYVNCNPMCPELKSGRFSNDSENTTMDCVIVSCPPQGVKVEIVQYPVHSTIICENDSNSNLEQPRKVVGAKPIATKRAKRKVRLPPRENTILNNTNSYHEKNNNCLPVLHQDLNDVMLNIKQDTINELPIEDVITLTVSSVESEEKKENSGWPLLETCLTDQINVKRIIDSVTSELSTKGLKDQNNTDLSQSKYRCRNICCNRHFRNESSRTIHEKRCLKNSFVQWRDDEMYNKTKML